MRAGCQSQGWPRDDMDALPTKYATVFYFKTNGATVLKHKSLYAARSHDLPFTERVLYQLC